MLGRWPIGLYAIAEMTLLRSLVGTAAISSATSDAVLAILRELEGSADMASSTSEAIMALGVLVDTILESLTPIWTVESLTPIRTVESI